MNEQIIPTEGQLESSEARGAETQALDDATYEPNAYVEGSGDYQQAEAIQNSITELVNNEVENKATPEAPIQEINFEKPIENEELTDSMSEMGNLDDLGNMIPGQGEIGGLPGGMGGYGLSGGPSDLKNDPGGEKPPPGGFPTGNDVMNGEGWKDKNEFWTTNLSYSEERYERAKESTIMSEMSDEIEPLNYDHNESDKPMSPDKPAEEDFAPTVSSDYKEREEEMSRFHKEQQKWEDEKNKQKDAPKNNKEESETVPEEGSSGNSMSEEPNSKYDQGQISVTTEDQTGSGSDQGGSLSETGKEKVKMALETKGNLDAAKAGAEVITDPPVPSNKMMENSKEDEKKETGSGEAG